MKPADYLFPNEAAAKAAGHCAFKDSGCQSLEDPKVLTEADFRDALSVREWQISGLCQACQDDMFPPEEE